MLTLLLIKFGAWIHQTLTQRGTAVKSMSSPGSIQKWPLESILKRLETAFLWEHAFGSIASLCNNGVKMIGRRAGVHGFVKSYISPFNRENQGDNRFCLPFITFKFHNPPVLHYHFLNQS